MSYTYEELQYAIQSTFFSEENKKIFLNTSNSSFVLLSSVSVNGKNESLVMCGECGNTFTTCIDIRYLNLLTCPVCNKKLTAHALYYNSRGKLPYRSWLEEARYNSITVKEESGVSYASQTNCFCLTPVFDGYALFSVAVRLVYDKDLNSVTKEILMMDNGIGFINTNEAYEITKENKKYVLQLAKLAKETYFYYFPENCGFSNPSDLQAVIANLKTKRISTAVKKEPVLLDEINSAFLKTHRISVGDTLGSADNVLIKTKEEVDRINSITTSEYHCGACGCVFNDMFIGKSKASICCPKCGLTDLSNNIFESFIPSFKARSMVYASTGDDYIFLYTGKIYKQLVNSSVVQTVRSLFKTFYAFNMVNKKMYSLTINESTGLIDSVAVCRSVAKKGDWINKIDNIYFNSNDLRFTRTGFTEFFEDTKCYCMGNDLLSYLQLSIKYPVIEKLAKAGYSNLIIELFKNDLITICPLNFTAENIQDFFVVPSYILKAFKKSSLFKDRYPANVVIDLLNGVLKINTKTGINTLSDIDVAYIFKYRLTTKISFFSEIANYNISLSSQIKFLERVRVNQCISPDKAIIIWRDYLNAANKLKIDMSDKKVIFPSSLRREHDIVTYKASLIYNNTLVDQFAEKVKKYGSLYSYTLASSPYIITCPETMEDLFEEGRKLNHCVGNYADSIIEGSDIIMFLRYKETPNEPFYTIGIKSNGIITEIATENNAPLKKFKEPVLCEFIEHWAEVKNLYGVSSLIK